MDNENQPDQPQLIDVDSIDAERDFEMMPNPEINPADVIEPEQLLEDAKTAEELVVSLSDSLESMVGIYREIRQRGQISRAEAQTLRNVTASTESMQAFFQQTPMNSYTEMGSMVNYNATCEGLVGSIVNAIRTIIRKVWEFIKKAGRYVLQLLTSRRAQDKKADMMDKVINKRLDELGVEYDTAEQADAWEAFFEGVSVYWNGLTKAMVTSPATLHLDALTTVLGAVEGEVKALLTIVDNPNHQDFEVPAQTNLQLNTGLTAVDNAAKAARQHTPDYYSKIIEALHAHLDDLDDTRAGVPTMEEVDKARDFVKNNTHTAFNASIERAAGLLKEADAGVMKALDIWGRQAPNMENVSDAYVANMGIVFNRLKQLSFDAQHFATTRMRVSRGRDLLSKLNGQYLATAAQVAHSSKK